MIASSSALQNPPALIGHIERGASEAASNLSKKLDQFAEHYSSPRLDLLVSEIMSVARNSVANDAEITPINHPTIVAAIEFAKMLPKSLPIPEISADPDGEISFDWIGKSNKMFTASINGARHIAYAGRFSEVSKIHGIEPLVESIPKEILRGIERSSE